MDLQIFMKSDASFYIAVADLPQRHTDEKNYATIYIVTYDIICISNKPIPNY